MYLLFELTRPVHPAQRPVTDDGRATRRGRRRTAVRPSRAVVIVSGLSGGGKTAAAKLFEDLGYTVVDNLPGRAAARPRRARLVRPRALRPGRDRPRRPGRRRDARPRGDARRARRPRHPAAGRLPRGARRGPHPALQRDAPPPPARPTSAGSPARSPRSAACSSPSGPRRTSSSTRPTCRCAQLRERLFAQLGDRRPTRTSSRSSSSASASSTASRSRPTSCSTSGSCRTRTTSPSCGQLSGPDRRRSATFVLGQPVATRFLDVPRASSSTFAIPAYVARGQDPADDRHRLHRRLPPLDRHRRGARGAGCASRTSGRSRSSTGELDARRSNLRRWLTPGHRDQALAARRLRGPAAARPRLRPPPPPDHPRPRADRHRRRAHRPPDAPVPAVRAARAHRRRRSGSRSSLFGSYRVVHVLTDPLRAPTRTSRSSS